MDEHQVNLLVLAHLWDSLQVVDEERVAGYVDSVTAFERGVGEGVAQLENPAICWWDLFPSGFLSAFNLKHQKRKHNIRLSQYR